MLELVKFELFKLELVMFELPPRNCSSSDKVPAKFRPLAIDLLGSSSGFSLASPKTPTKKRATLIRCLQLFLIYSYQNQL